MKFRNAHRMNKNISCLYKRSFLIARFREEVKMLILFERRISVTGDFLEIMRDRAPRRAREKIGESISPNYAIHLPLYFQTNRYPNKLHVARSAFCKHIAHNFERNNVFPFSIRNCNSLEHRFECLFRRNWILRHYETAQKRVVFSSGPAHLIMRHADVNFCPRI